MIIEEDFFKVRVVSPSPTLWGGGAKLDSTDSHSYIIIIIIPVLISRQREAASLWP